MTRDEGRGEGRTAARPPTGQSGAASRDGVSLHFDVYGDAATTVLLLPTWSIVTSRFWKAQVAFLARHYRVVTFDGRGSGRSSRPRGAAAYADHEFAADALAVLDATQTDGRWSSGSPVEPPGPCTWPPRSPNAYRASLPSHPPAGSRSPVPTSNSPAG